MSEDALHYLGIEVNSARFKKNKAWLQEVEHTYMAMVDKDPTRAVHAGAAFESWIPPLRISVKALFSNAPRREVIDLTDASLDHDILMDIAINMRKSLTTQEKQLLIVQKFAQRVQPQDMIKQAAILDELNNMNDDDDDQEDGSAGSESEQDDWVKPSSSSSSSSSAFGSRLEEDRQRADLMREVAERDDRKQKEKEKKQKEKEEEDKMDEEQAPKKPPKRQRRKRG